MSDVDPTSSFYKSEVIAPVCTKCRAPMQLQRVHPGKHGSYRGTYICHACGRSIMDDVTLASPEMSKAE
jgi:superfamily II helicase